MKRIYLLSLTLFLFIGSFAQSTSNLIVFSANGEPFYLVLNGIRQNADPETNVKVTGINEGSYLVKVVFHDEELPDVDKNWLINPDVEITAMIDVDKKGKYKLKYRGEIPLDHETSTSTDQTAVTYTTVPRTDVSTDVAVTESTTTTTTVTTDTQVNDNMDGGENVSMNVNMDGVNFSMDVNVDDMGMDTDMTMDESSTTSTTTSTTTTTYTTTTNTNTVDNNTTVVTDNSYSGRTGCVAPQSATEFRTAKAAVEAEDFDDDMLMVAKQMTRNSCLSVDQVKEIVNLFDFSDDKLEYAKFAYDYTYDQGNYYKVNDCFDFSSDKEELNDFLSTK